MSKKWHIFHVGILLCHRHRRHHATAIANAIADPWTAAGAAAANATFRASCFIIMTARMASLSASSSLLAKACAARSCRSFAVAHPQVGPCSGDSLDDFAPASALL
jgi:hypothetical protein